MMRIVKLLGFVVLVTLASSVFASYASAQQYQPQSGMSNMQRTPVNGTYANSNYGVQITLPDGWSGFEIKRSSGTTSVIAAPGGYQFMQGHRPPVSMMITMVPKSVMPTPQFMSQRMMQNETCTNDSTANKTVNGVNLSELVMDCTGQFMIKSKYDVAQTSSSYIIVSYRANSTSNYDSQVATFDSAVGNLQIANTLQAPAIPEFPIAAIGIIVAIMVGAVVVLGRIRPIPRI